MARTLGVVAVLFLALHGLIHLMGTTVYMRLGHIQGLAFKTTLLGGRWDLGERGIAVFGALLALAAFGFVLASGGLLVGWNGARCLAAGVAMLSLILTLLDWEIAFAGAIVNFVILAALFLGPKISGAFAA